MSANGSESRVSPGMAFLEIRKDEVESLFGISQVLQCGLDRRTLAVLLQLVEAGVHPEALADLVLRYRAEAPTTGAAP
jgi:hypothetical protein